MFGLQSWIPYLVIFPITFGIGYKKRLGYKMPLAFEISDFLGKIMYRATHLRKKVQEMKKKEETVTVKVEEKKATSETEKNQ